MDTRTKIIQASLDLFAERGYEAVKTKAIARAADVNESTIFKYFSGKTELYKCVISENLKILDGHDLCHKGLTGDLERDLEAIGKQMYHLYEVNAKVIRITLKSAMDGDDNLSEYVPVARGGHVKKHLDAYFSSVRQGRYAEEAEAISRYFLSCVNGYLMNCFVFDQERADMKDFLWMIKQVYRSID